MGCRAGAVDRHARRVRYKVTESDAIEFTGTSTPAAGGVTDEVGLTVAKGADQLTGRPNAHRQSYYLAAPAPAVKLSD